MKAPIKTFTGKLVDLADLRMSDVSLLDIIRGLSHINRFNGQTKEPISVGQHSVFVTRIVRLKTQDPLKLRQALLHDASEAYIGDMTKWFKQLPEMEGFRKLEELIQDAIYDRFGLPYTMYPEVAEADKIAVTMEGRHPLGHGPSFLEDHEEYPPITDPNVLRLFNDWIPWQPAKTREEFKKEWEFINKIELEEVNV